MSSESGLGAVSDMGSVRLNTPEVNVSLGDLTIPSVDEANSPSGMFDEWSEASLLRGDVRFVTTTDLTIHEKNLNSACPFFETFNVTSTASVSVMLVSDESGTARCALSNFYGITDAPAGSDGLAIWNTLNVAGTLDLQDGANLALVNRRPLTKNDSTYAYPGASITGSITSSDATAMLYIAVEPEMITKAVRISAGVVGSTTGYGFMVSDYTGWANKVHRKRLYQGRHRCLPRHWTASGPRVFVLPVGVRLIWGCISSRMGG